MADFDPGYFESEDFEEMCREDFDFYDKDKSGFIDTTEIKNILQMQSDRIEMLGQKNYVYYPYYSF